MMACTATTHPQERVARADALGFAPAEAHGSVLRPAVSEGGLEPPCPFGALAPQASASAYSATRTWFAEHTGVSRALQSRGGARRGRMGGMTTSAERTHPSAEDEVVDLCQELIRI